MSPAAQQSPRQRVLATLLSTLFMFYLSGASAEEIPIHTLLSPPTMDGDGRDWSDVPATIVTLHKSKADASEGPTTVLVKGGVFGEYVCFYFEWEDSSEDILHKPWVWDAAKKKYVRGPQREDRLAIQFATGGNYSTDWLSGAQFTADMWHWKASRSNPAGLAHDKSTTISSRKLTKSYKGVAHDGGALYIARPGDSGTGLYTTKRYHAHQQDTMPKYILNDSVAGSVADVEARGVWRDGKWHLEVRRKLNTGHSDDAVFVRGQATLGGIAVFEHSANDDHVVSNNLTFQF